MKGIDVSRWQGSINWNAVRMELKGDRAVIGVNGQVTAAINIRNIRKV